MVQIPEELARSIQAGDCVLWAGAGLGSLAGRPSWEGLIDGLIEECPQSAQAGLRELLEQGRLRTVLTYVHRHFGDEPLAQLLRAVSTENADVEIDERAQGLARMPWRACFATTYADVLGKVFERAGLRAEVISHLTVHHLSLREQRDLVIVKTPPTGRAMRTDSVLFDLVEEVVRTRTILFFGFEPDDPDLQQVLELVDRIGRGNQHFAVLPFVSGPEAEEWSDRFGIQILHASDEPDLLDIVDELVQAANKAVVRPSGVEGKHAILDLTRAVRPVPIRCDLALDVALTLDRGWVEHLIERLPGGGSLTGVPAATLLKAGGVMLAHGETEVARRCFQQVVSLRAEGEQMNTARFNLTMTSLAEGDREEALQGLSLAADADRSLAIVPPRFELDEIHGMAGSQMFLSCRDRGTGDKLDVEVSTLGRPAGGEEQQKFTAAVQELVAVEHPAVCRARGGFADGRLFGVMYEPAPGFILADTLVGAEPMTLEKAWELFEPLSEALEACHARGVLHRNLTPQQVLVSPDGARLRGFGFPPVVGYTRPSVRRFSRGYLAPELVDGHKATPAADVYGLAAILYRVLTGEAPAGSVPAPDTFHEEHDPRLGPLLRGALHPDPARRLPLREIRAQIQHLLETPGVGRMHTAQETTIRPGQERVVDLGPPGAPVPTLAAKSSPIEEGIPEVVTVPSSAKIILPEDPDDLEAWAWILERKPHHQEAKKALDRIEAEGRADNRWDRVADVLQVRVQFSQAQQERVELLLELARLYETELGAPGNAFESLRTLIGTLDAERQLEVTDELSRLAEVTGRWSDLADALFALSERVSEAEAQAGVYTMLGRVYADRLGAPEQALGAFEKAVGLEATAERLEAMVPLQRKAGKHTDVVTTLLSLADQQEGPDRHESLLGASRILRDDLDDPEGALGALDVVLAEAPDHADALEDAETLARALERWDLLVNFLGRRADATLDPTESTALRREAAEIASRHQHDDAIAISQLIKVVEADREDKDAANHLIVLLRPVVATEPSRRLDLIDALGVLGELVTTPEEKAALLAEMASLLDQEPDGQERAIECREQVLDSVPANHEVAAGVIEALEKTYRRQDNFYDLERLYQRMTEDKLADDDVIVEAWRKLLELRDGPLEDESGGVAALEALTRLQPKETRWRDDLLERYLEREEFERAGPLIRAQVFDEPDPKRKAELLLRGGNLRVKIGKTEKAIEALEEAVALDPELVEAWLSLRDLYDQQGQSLKANEALVSAALGDSNRLDRTRRLYEAGVRYIRDLERGDRGAEILESVIELDPDHREATSALLKYLVADEQLQRAWPHAQTFVMQVRSQAADDKALNLRALSLAGRCALAVDANAKAREYLEKAKALDAANVDVLRLLADLDLDGGRFAEALRNYQSVVLASGTKIAPAELSALYVRMAQARVGMDEPQKAVQMLDRALETDADNEAALRLLDEVGTLSNDAVVTARAKIRLAECLARRMETLEPGDAHKAAFLAEQVALLDAAATVQHQQLKLPGEAIQTLERILELTPDDPAVLHRILDVFTAEERWRDCTHVLERLAHAQDSPAYRAKYLWAGALVLRDNLERFDEAKKWFSRCLEADPQHEGAFEAYLAALRKDRAWSDISKAIRAHMKAMPKSTKPFEMAQLFEQLGDAHERMQDPNTAIAAYDQAARMAAKAGVDLATQREFRERVVKLGVSLGDDELDKAVHHAHAIISGSPMDFEVYHRLVEIYLKQGSRDRARCVARTLCFLKQADEAERDLASGRPTAARSALTRDRMRHEVCHPLENPRVSDVFALVWSMVAAREGRTHAHRGVKRSDRNEVTMQSPTALARYLAYACQILDAPVPDLFLQPGELGDLDVDALAEGTGGQRKVYATLLAGRAALGDQDETSLKFRAGRAADRARPEHILASLLPSPATLRYAVYGAFRVVDPTAPLPDDVRGPAASYAEQIAPYVKGARLDQLKLVVEPLIAAGDPDLRAWTIGVAHTSTRAAFILSDSIELSAQILTREGDDGSPTAAKERIADLVSYSVSEAYLGMRKHLGLGR